MTNDTNTKKEKPSFLFDRIGIFGGFFLKSP